MDDVVVFFFRATESEQPASLGDCNSSNIKINATRSPANLEAESDAVHARVKILVANLVFGASRWRQFVVVEATSE